MIYAISFLCSVLLCKQACKSRNLLKLGCFTLSFLIPAFIAGMRDYNVGADTSLYVIPMFEQAIQCETFVGFKKIIASGINVEFLYICLIYLISKITSNPNLYLFFSHIVMYGSFFFAFYKMRKEIILEFSVFIFLVTFFGETLNAARQCFALGFCTIAFYYLISNKIIPTALFTVIAYGFHHTTIIFCLLILIYLLSKKNWVLMEAKKVKFMLICTFFSGLTFFSLILQSFSSVGLIDGRYEDRYASASQYGTNIPISLFALNIVNIFVFKLMKKKGNMQGPLVCFFEYTLLISLLTNFSGLISTFAVRMGYYFLYMITIIFPYMYKACQPSKQLRIFHYSFFSFYWIMTIVIANLGKTYPYSSNVLGIN